MVRWLAILGVVAHGIVAWFHGDAHRQLGVGLNDWQRVFVDVVILAAPVVAIVMLWTRIARWGYLLLALAMAGALVFGVYHHFIAISPDNIAHLPEGNAQAMFKTTAVLLVVTETFATIIGCWGWLAGRAQV
jgi:hypothetical protein